jgi:hypothetical protein
MGKIVLPLIISTLGATSGNTIAAGYPLGQHWFDSTAGVEYIHKSDGVWESSLTGINGTMDYTGLTNKPQINSVELTGNRTIADLGLQPAGNYATTTTVNTFTASQTVTNGTNNNADAKISVAVTNSTGTAKFVASVNGESSPLYSELGAYPSSNQMSIFGGKLGGAGGLWLTPLLNSFGFIGTTNNTPFIIGSNAINRIEIVPGGNINVVGEIVNDSGKKLSTNDYTTDEQNKLAEITGTNTGDEIAVGTTTPTGNEDLWIDPTSPEITTADIPDVNGYRYLNENQYNGIWLNGIQVGNNTEVASSSNVGRIRYRTSGNNSYVEMCMQTSASTYDWKIIYQNNW